MLPGPFIVLKLPTSGTLVTIWTTASGNTIGAEYWTDGKQEGAMLPEQPRLQRHSTTNELFWREDCQWVAVEPFSYGDESAECEKAAADEFQTTYKNVSLAQDPTAGDYQRALTSGLASTPEKEKYIRLRYWWLANDPVRHRQSIERKRQNLLRSQASPNCSDPEIAAHLSEELRNVAAQLRTLQARKYFEPRLPGFRENLLKLRALLDLTDPEERLLSAETARLRNRSRTPRFSIPDGLRSSRGHNQEAYQ